MATLQKEYIEKIQRMYQRGFSMQEIADQLDVSLSAVVYFFRRWGIQRRSRGEANHIVFSKRAPSFRVKSNLTTEEKTLATIATCLYWAEGSKWLGEKIVDFANSDPEMIRIFLRFLREICSVEESKFRVLLYCHSDIRIPDLIHYWVGVTGISAHQFTKPTVRKGSLQQKKQRMPNGLVHIRYADKKLLTFLMQSIEDLKQTWVGSKAVKCS